MMMMMMMMSVSVSNKCEILVHICVHNVSSLCFLIELNFIMSVTVICV